MLYIYTMEYNSAIKKNKYGKLIKTYCVAQGALLNTL